VTFTCDSGRHAEIPDIAVDGEEAKDQTMRDAAQGLYIASIARVRSPGDLASAYRDCEAVARRTAKNFYYSFLVLPTDQRQSMCALYTFLRGADDVGDVDAPVEDRKRALAQWRRRLGAVVAGDFEGCDRWWLAFADVVHRYELPINLATAVLDGVGSDLEERRFADFADLYGYCYRVASAVGLLCIRIWGARGERADALAEWCGVAFQLTNILRDVAEDRDRGRIYFPENEIARFGLKPSDLATPASPAFVAFMQFQIRRAECYYDRAEALLDYVPPAGKAVLRAMIDIYRGLLKKIKADPAAVLSRRVSLHPAHKLALAARALPLRIFGSAAVREEGEGEF
jgi:phytoene synthase